MIRSSTHLMALRRYSSRVVSAAASAANGSFRGSRNLTSSSSDLASAATTAPHSPPTRHQMTSSPESHTTTTKANDANSSSSAKKPKAYTNFNETITARECIEKYGHVLGSNQIAAVAFGDDGQSVAILGATASDPTNPAGSGHPITANANSSTTDSSLSSSSSSSSPNKEKDAPDSSDAASFPLRPAVIRIGGRVVSIRDMGKVVFVTIRSDGELMQLAANVTAEFYPTKEHLRAAITDVLNTGDVVGAEGTVGRTKKGELTVFVRKISVLAPYVCADMAVCPDSRIFNVITGSGNQKTGVGAAQKKSGAVDETPAGSNTNGKGEEEKPLSKSQLKKLKKKQEKKELAERATAESDGGAPKATETKVESPPPSSDVSLPEPTTATTPLATTATSNVISDPDLRYRYRFVDLVARPNGIKVFRLRHKVISSLRRFLDDKNFTEVETPMFHTIPCGANAKPFMTHHNSNNSDLYLRIAPELYLKQCVVGGLERVYEIGKVFRNEDTDKSHNPEFTSCEFYAAYKNYVDLMGWTEELLRFIAKEATGTTILRLPSSQQGDGTETQFVEVDLARPFRRVSVLDEIEKKTGVMFPNIDEINSSFGIAFMAAVMLKHDIQPPTIRTPGKYLDKLIDHFITDNTTDPIFVCDHPLFMSPLAKEHEWEYDDDNSKSKSTENNKDSFASPLSSMSVEGAVSATTAAPSFPLFSERNGKRGLSERFELFINGMEVCNAYSELCDPSEQLKRFEQQLQAKELGDDEAMEPDETFLKALQVGLPPTAGWGMGIDRLVMLLSGHASIRDVILFPLLKPRNDLSNRRRSKNASFFGFNHSMAMFALSSLEAELKRRGDRAGCEHLKQTKRIVQQAARNPELHRKQLMVELEKGLAMQREQFWWLHGNDESLGSLGGGVGGGIGGKKLENGAVGTEATTIWPPTSPSALAALMGFSSKPPQPTSNSSSLRTAEEDQQEHPNKQQEVPKSYTTTASISSSSSTSTHTTTTTTTTTTTINAHFTDGEGGGHTHTGAALSREHVRTGMAVHNAHTMDAWSRWRRLAYRHNPFWKFVVRYCGGRNE